MASTSVGFSTTQIKPASRLVDVQMAQVSFSL